MLDLEDFEARPTIRIQVYLSSYWMVEALWQSWSDFGIYAAAEVLGWMWFRPTTNHLEAFNRVLKHKHVAGQQQSGRRLRLDVLLNFVVRKMMSSIFQQREMIQEARNQRRQWILSLPGGAELLQSQRQNSSLAQLPPVAYLATDEPRTTAACTLLEHRQLKLDTVPKIYNIRLFLSGSASCTCADFSSRGGACKHLRAALMALDHYHQRPPFQNVPRMILPSSEQEARSLLLKMASEPTEYERKATNTPTSLAADLLQTLAEASADSRPHTVESEPQVNELDSEESAQEETSPDIPTMDLPSENPTMKIDSKSTQCISRDGVIAQAMTRTLFDLDILTPKLNQLLECFPTNVPLPSPEENIPRANQAISTLLLLAQVLQTAVDSTNNTGHQSGLSRTTNNLHVLSSNNQSPPKAEKRSRPEELLPPSPEKRQERQDSHSIH
ncbi:hypothetical protein L218DRAFT_1072256 [Marasmius fiardii PR-910]|nr:hypothetical protein L218DRAFT_1072256 [Marasmius fiardii PR-910]